MVLITGLWWLLAVGAASILAAWFYTGGRHPYGYLGLGEVFVFIFFGLVAVLGTHLVLARGLDWAALVAAVGIGSLACALLVVNNLRDIPTDIASGKRTLATRLGESGTRAFFTGLLTVGLVSVAVVAALTSWWALLALAMAPFTMMAVRTVGSGARGLALIPALKRTGQAELFAGIGLLLGIALSQL